MAGRYDSVVVGSGPNGIAAAITIAQAGRSVLVLESADTPGGGARTAELTLPGFRHDVCSAMHPLAVGSPFLSTLPLAEHGLEWIHPRYPVAHPLDDGSAAVLERDVDATAANLGDDAESYRNLMSPFVRDWSRIAAGAMGPLRPPHNPIAMGRFGLKALRSARGLANSRLRTVQARALFAGIAAHSVTPLEFRASAAAGLILQVAGHAVGWPMPRGGAQSLTDAMVSYLQSLGGEVVTGVRVDSLDELPQASAVLLDVGARELGRISGDRLPTGYRRKLDAFRYGPGVFKIDWALAAPIPWTAAECGDAGTLHLGGTLEEIAAAEAAVWRGEHPERPFVLLAQPTMFDNTRAPSGKHIAWAYCHVPNGSDFDMTERIEAQVERFAPGFRDRVLACSVMSPSDVEAYNANYVGGDIGGGANTLHQLFARPVSAIAPYRTPIKGVYLCSASTPPGAGVHGMCGYWAARDALKRL
ncbi:MAG: NAD(P)/FAD-dependent oxidoreductase [Dehalococcoidia bacterium]|nr:NAD(P)/FAD-dependent oxidoreductase [Dehalococcoidia bacterium]